MKLPFASTQDRINHEAAIRAMFPATIFQAAIRYRAGASAPELVYGNMPSQFHEIRVGRDWRPSTQADKLPGGV